MSNYITGYPAGTYIGTAIGTSTTQLYPAVQTGYPQSPSGGPIRNALSERCATAVFRFNGQVTLSDLAKEMPGDYDQNRKILSDVFLLSQPHMTLEEAASLAFVLREEVGGFLDLCERSGVLIPSGE